MINFYNYFQEIIGVSSISSFHFLSLLQIKIINSRKVINRRTHIKVQSTKRVNFLIGLRYRFRIHERKFP